ncbi:MAG: phosphomannomutase/phosphoglucomutase, partial [Micrococcales bacterium]|nr:phosphomannomutase/phosphoglucomutase [Micrococcales bacterium]
MSQVVNAYDVRGRVGQDLDASVVTALAAAFADVVAHPGGHTQVAVGHDMRASCAELTQAVVDGLAARGVGSLALGLCSTDELYYACGVRALPGVMVTAGNHPADHNGMKLCAARAAPVDEDTGLYQVASVAERYLRDGVPQASDRDVVHSTWDVLDDYAAYLHSLVDLAAIRPLSVVVDAGNGMAALTVPAVLGPDAGLAGVPVRLFEVHMRMDGRMPSRVGGLLEGESLDALRSSVLEHHADLGLAFD